MLSACACLILGHGKRENATNAKMWTGLDGLDLVALFFTAVGSGSGSGLIKSHHVRKSEMQSAECRVQNSEFKNSEFTSPTLVLLFVED